MTIFRRFGGCVIISIIRRFGGCVIISVKFELFTSTTYQCEREREREREFRMKNYV